MKKYIGFLVVLSVLVLGAPIVNAAAITPITGANKACLPSTTPWIKVTSPNGGEVFTQGNPIPITWVTCNILASATIIPVFNYVDSNDYGEVHNSGAQSLTYVLNTGSTIITPPPALTTILGTHFKITLVYQPYATGQNAFDARDSSDNLFTINPAKSAVTTTVVPKVVTPAPIITLTPIVITPVSTTAVATNSIPQIKNSVTPITINDIKAAQQVLINKGYLHGKADGKVGKLTIKAVKDFQKAQGHLYPPI